MVADAVTAILCGIEQALHFGVVEKVLEALVTVRRINSSG
jgi:hypothetical protein